MSKRVSIVEYERVVKNVCNKCSRIKGHNGKSPIVLAGANIKAINWIKFSQK